MTFINIISDTLNLSQISGASVMHYLNTYILNFFILVFVGLCIACADNSTSREPNESISGNDSSHDETLS